MYFIGFTLPNPARSAHEDETGDLASRFGIQDLGKRSVPHLTFWAPFETDAIDVIIERLREFCSRQHVGKVVCNDYEFFNNTEKGTSSIVWRFTPDQTALVFVRKLTQFLSTIPELPSDDRQGRSKTREETLHASVARFLTPEQFIEVSKYCKDKQKFSYEMKLDSVSVYYQIDGKWEDMVVMPIGK